MLFMYLIVAVDAYLLAIIVKRITNSLKFAWLSALVFLVLYLYLDGAYFILETFSLCCGLVALVLLVRKNSSPWRCLFSGACCALAFLSKQYGLLFAGVIGVLLLLSGERWKSWIISCFYAFSGFCVVLVLFVSSFMLLGLRLEDMVMSLSGSTYGGQSLGMYVDGVVKACRLFPYLLFIPFILFGKKNKEKPLTWACCSGLVLASFQFYFNVFPHYYIFMLPFVLILNALLWKKIRSHNGMAVCFLLYFGVLFTACAFPFQRVYKETKSLVKHDLRVAQESTAKQLREVVRDYGIETALCYMNAVPYYGLCPLFPSSIAKYGFAFGDDTEETYLERLKDADCFVVQQGELKNIQSMNNLAAVLSRDYVLLENRFSDGLRVFVKRGE